MRAGGHDEANSRFSQCCERAQKPQITLNFDAAIIHFITIQIPNNIQVLVSMNLLRLDYCYLQVSCSIHVPMHSTSRPATHPIGS
jgi:hypothetical protein